ncbi:sensor histidine kinase [Pontibacter toksunensis]|uniref:histidine kinase n=1 Tax=Pontibacter toksunensis TaxID=1332631 RepID=A0ABW6BV81_9BACT
MELEPWIPLLILIPVMLLLALGVIGFMVLFQKRLHQHQQNLQKLQAARQQQLLEVTMQAQEEERRRVARDLHDEIGTMLSLVKLNLYQLSPVMEGASEELRAVERHIKQLLDEVIGSVRRISQDLMPVVLDKMGLQQALEALRRSVPDTSGVQVAFVCNDKSRRMAPKLELMLFRIVQELLNNSLKHAQASTISIELHLAEKEATMRYADNGVGFDYVEVLQKGQGMGVVSLQSRVDLLKGKMKTRSLAGVGTQVEVIVPIQQSTDY